MSSITIKKLLIIIPIVAAISMGGYFIVNKSDNSTNQPLTENIVCPVSNTDVHDYEEAGTLVEMRKYDHLCPSKQKIIVLTQSSSGDAFLKLRNQVAESIFILEQQFEPEEKREIVQKYRDGVFLLEGGSYQWVSGNTLFAIKSEVDFSSGNTNQVQVNEITNLVDHYLTLYPSTDDLIVAQPEQTSFAVKERDSTRHSDIYTIRFALALYFQDKQAYPSGVSLSLGHDSSACLGDTGWTSTRNCSKSYLDQVPRDPLSSKAYVYTQLDKGSSYKITFEFEGGIGGNKPGAHTLRPEGIE